MPDAIGATGQTASRYDRIAILGGAGAGKSTLARAVGEALNLPVIHLDRFVFGPGWRRRDGNVVMPELAEALREGRWVVDGTYPEFRDLVLRPADLVLWIEQPLLVRLTRSWRKARTSRTRIDRPDGCEEKFDFGYIRTIASFGRYTPEIETMLTSSTSAPIVRLKGDGAVQNFMDKMHADCLRRHLHKDDNQNCFSRRSM